MFTTLTIAYCHTEPRISQRIRLACTPPLPILPCIMCQNPKATPNSRQNSNQFSDRSMSSICLYEMMCNN